MAYRIALSAAAAMVLAARPIAAQRMPPAQGVVLRGTVRDGTTHAPLAAVTITLDVGGATSTDDKGDFALSVPAARAVRVLLRRLGYDSLAVTLDSVPADHPRYAFELSRTPHALDTVTVGARPKSWSPKLEGFEQRMARRNGGTFFTREDIDQRRPLVVSDLVRRSPGVRIVDSMGVRLFASSRGSRISDTPRGGRKSAPCIMRVGVDGQVMEWGFAADQIATPEVYGIEVYSGPATVPREYASQVADGYCGLVMIWTR